MPHDHLIRNAAHEFMNPKVVMEGLINSALLTPTQREDLDGMIRNPIPAGMSRRDHSGIDVPVISVKPSATKVEPGARHFPGSRYV